MGAIVVVLLLVLVLAAVVMLYVAYPYRGQDTPVSPLLGHAMRRGVKSLRTVDLEPASDEPVSISQQNAQRSTERSTEKSRGSRRGSRRGRAWSRRRIPTVEPHR